MVDCIVGLRWACADHLKMWLEGKKYDGKARKRLLLLRQFVRVKMGKDIGKNKNSTTLVSSKYKPGPSSLEEEDVSDGE